MLDENPANITAINDAIIYVHRNNVLPPAPPAGVNFTAATGTLLIDYGFNGAQNGRIEIIRGQFQVNRVTNAQNVLVAPASYNHAGRHSTRQSYIDALRSNNLSLDQSLFSAMIILTSESCRSQMVSTALAAIMGGHANFSDDVWAGLQFAFNSYAHTAAFKGYNIQAGGSPWSWLRVDDYLGYINSAAFTGDRARATGYINAVKTYNNTAP